MSRLTSLKRHKKKEVCAVDVSQPLNNWEGCSAKCTNRNVLRPRTWFGGALPPAYVIQTWLSNLEDATWGQLSFSQDMLVPFLFTHDAENVGLNHQKWNRRIIWYDDKNLSFLYEILGCTYICKGPYSCHTAHSVWVSVLFRLVLLRTWLTAICGNDCCSSLRKPLKKSKLSEALSWTHQSDSLPIFFI